MSTDRMRTVNSRTLAFITSWILLVFSHSGILFSQSTAQQRLVIEVNPADGSYTFGVLGLAHTVLRSGIALQCDGHWVHSGDYPKRSITTFSVADDLGMANEWKVTFSGLSGEPDLTYRLRAYPDRPVADIQVTVRNSTPKLIRVESIRPVEALGNSILDLGDSAPQYRVLSDSFSENRPDVSIRDLGDAEGQIHRGVGSQLIYNRRNHESFFAGTLTSDRFLTILRAHVSSKSGQPRITAYEVDSTGTTELQTGSEGSLQDSAAEDQMPLVLSVSPGAELSSENLLFSIDSNYHRQLETYGAIIRKLHHARVSASTPMGWWSWTAYYFGLDEGTALTNAEWEAQHLTALGYNFFHIDEGYQYARGEYSTPNATVFPHGLAFLEGHIASLGLVPGIWTAPFEVSDRSWIYRNHPDWLVHNAEGKPIHLRWVKDHEDRLFALDCTNPGAQAYLRKTYTTLVEKWGIRYIKMDFMDDTAIEGHYFRPNTTALEAQRIGLGIIRDTVGNNVLLDKDGSVMLNPVGYVDFGRISVDTGHIFKASKEAAPGIAARYYMNRNFFVSDPDAFTVSKQFVKDQSWHGGQRPLTLDEAKVSIALAAVSGGMYEIGDDLPTLGSDPERLALVENEDLIDMARLGKASTPVDLMSYLPEDEQPSIFLLKESARQSILTIFNWTDRSRSHAIALPSLGLSENGLYTISDVFDKKPVPIASNSLFMNQPAHSVRVLKIIDSKAPALAPLAHAQHPSSAKTGEAVSFSAGPKDSATPVISYRWDFGDGVTLRGTEVTHAYTHPGNYQVELTEHGIDGLASKSRFHLLVTGFISTQFAPDENRRYHGSE